MNFLRLGVNIHVLFISDDYGTLYPFTPHHRNQGRTIMFTKEEIDEMKVVTNIVRCSMLIFQ